MGSTRIAIDLTLLQTLVTVSVKTIGIFLHHSSRIPMPALKRKFIICGPKQGASLNFIQIQEPLSAIRERGWQPGQFHEEVAIQLWEVRVTKE